MKYFRKTISAGLLVTVFILNTSFAALNICVASGISGEMTCCKATHASSAGAEIAFSSTICGCQITVATLTDALAVLVDSGKFQVERSDNSAWHAHVTTIGISSKTAIPQHLKSDSQPRSVRYTKIYDLVSSYLI